MSNEIVLDGSALEKYLRQLPAYERWLKENPEKLQSDYPGDYPEEFKKERPVTPNTPKGTIVIDDKALRILRDHGFKYFRKISHGEGAWDLQVVKDLAIDQAPSYYDIVDENPYKADGDTVRNKKTEIERKNQIDLPTQIGRRAYETSYIRLGNRGPFIPVDIAGNEGILEGRSEKKALRIDDLLARSSLLKPVEPRPPHNPAETHILKTKRGDYADTHTERVRLGEKTKNLVVDAWQGNLEVTTEREDAVIDVRASVKSLTVKGPGGVTVIDGYAPTLNNHGPSKVIFDNLYRTVRGTNTNTDVIFTDSAIEAAVLRGEKFMLQRKDGDIVLSHNDKKLFSAPENMLKSIQVGDRGQRIDTSRLTDKPMEIDPAKGLPKPVPAPLPAPRPAAPPP